MYIDIDKAVAQALALRLSSLEGRVDGLENGAGQSASSEDSKIQGNKDFASICGQMGFTEKQILSHDRKGQLQDARYQVCRILLRGGLNIREVSRIMRRSCRSIQRMA
jgi:hypothetical protein